MHYEVVNEDVRYLRENCPITCSSVTGTGAGACYCCEKPTTPPATPPAPPSQCCVTKVVVNNLKRYRATTPGTHIKVCC